MAAASSRTKACIAIAQLRSTAVVSENVAAIRRVASQASSKGASMLFLPEASTAMGVSSAEAGAVPGLDACKADLSSIASDLGIWLSVCGHQPAEEKGRFHNMHWLLNSKGEEVAAYSKTHLFDAESLSESSYTRRGEELVAVQGTPAGCLGMCTCYDMRFPQVAQRLRFEAGADVLAFPSAFTVETGRAHWEVLLRSRAIETQCYVVAAAQWGDHGGGRETYGHSLVVDPWGSIIASCGEGAEQVALAHIDADVLEAVRKRMPLDSQRRPELYEPYSDSLKIVGAV